jgi:Flp pilus assembly protein TadD
VHRASGLLEEEAGSYETAISEYQRAIELEPKDGENYRRLGIVYGSNSQPADSLNALRKAAEFAPKDFRIYLDLGSFFSIKGEFGQAAKHFRKAVRLAPNEPQARFDLASACTSLGLYEEAEHEIRSAIRLQERSSFVAMLGVILMYEHQEKAAIPVLLRATTLGPDDSTSWMNLGTCYRRTRHAAKARWANLRGVRAAESRIAKNPRQAWVRSSLAFLCVNLGERSRAASEIAQALSLGPNDSDVQFRAVLTYEFLNRRDDALAILAAAPAGNLADVNRWPDLADLHTDPRFLDLLAARGIR